MNIHHKRKYVTMVVLFLAIFFPASSHARSTDINVKGDGLRVQQGDNEFEIGGALMWDFDRFDGLHLQTNGDSENSQNQSELRRARIDMKGKIGKEWQASLQFDFSDTETSVDVDDALIIYSGWKVAKVNVGQSKEPFGLENLTSSKYTTFIERSMVTNALSPGRQPGVGLNGDIAKKVAWALGLYEATSSETEGDTYATTGRLTAAPWHGDDFLLHLGISGSVRDMNGELFRIDETAEVHTAREFVDSPETQAETLSLLGLETALLWKSFSLQVEYMLADIKADVGENADYFGYYVQTSYFVTGESRRYNKGAFKKIKPKLKSGALELAARYSFLDARDNQEGTVAANTSLGATYYFNSQVRLIGNYIFTQLLEKDDNEEDDTGNAFSLRIQYVF